ncbi:MULTISPECIES: hypothetical protein [Chryseobacterium]|uniref:hypothetical protein n=1 Tax=Chryseobacterium TaxID=59732 RepID=UPI00210B8397|nr:MULTISPECIES: hypothetical protein [Chryseobacterium]MCQ4141177.1 hypothetical protein [Chryseobacterium sp. EO14]WBV54539.1 hypothetical protein PFY09_09470 [Chryseobacterium gambrini]
MKRITIYLFAAIFTLSSCNNVIDKKVSLETAKDDIKEIKEKYKDEYTEADFEALSNKLAGNVFGTFLSKGEDAAKGIKFEKTYKEYLEEAKKERLEKEKLAAEAKKKEAEKKAKMNAAAVVTIYGYNFHEADSNNYEFQDYHIFKYAVKNKSSKEIKAIKFHFNIYNSLGDELGKGFEMSLTNDRIQPNSTFQNSMMFDANSYNSDDNRIASSNFEDLKFELVVDKIVFSDGSILE